MASNMQILYAADRKSNCCWKVISIIISALSKTVTYLLCEIIERQRLFDLAEETSQLYFFFPYYTSYILTVSVTFLLHTQKKKKQQQKNTKINPTNTSWYRCQYCSVVRSGKNTPGQFVTTLFLTHARPFGKWSLLQTDLTISQQAWFLRRKLCLIWKNGIITHLQLSSYWRQFTDNTCRYRELQIEYPWNTLEASEGLYEIIAVLVGWLRFGSHYIFKS